MSYQAFTKKFCFITMIINYVLNLKFNRNNILLAINCGSKESEILKNTNYSKDQYYSENTYLMPEVQKIILELDQEEIMLFTNFRSSMEASFFYEIPMLNGPGKYELLLIFLEVWMDGFIQFKSYFIESEQRIFAIRLGDFTVIQNLDIYGIFQEFILIAIADNQPLVVPIAIQFTANEDIIFEFQLCQNAYKYTTNSVVIEFDRIQGYDLPKINAIILLDGWENDIQEYNNWRQFQILEKQILSSDLIKQSTKINRTWVGLIFSFKTLLALITLFLLYCCCCGDEQPQNETVKQEAKHKKRKRKE